MSTIATTPPIKADLPVASFPNLLQPKRPAGKPRFHRWTYEQFISLWELGILGRKRLELVDGRIIHMAPQNDPHAVGYTLAQQVLSKLFGEGFTIRAALPLQISVHSAPEPDVAVVKGSARDSLGRGHPSTALLLIEVSDTSLAYDRGLKANLYASAGIADYWIVNLVDRVVEVHRSPIADPSARLKHRYASVETFAPPSTVSPLAAPASQISVADLLP